MMLNGRAGSVINAVLVKLRGILGDSRSLISASPDSTEFEQLQREYQLLQDIVVMSGHEWRNHLSRLYIYLEIFAKEQAGLMTPRQTQLLESMRMSITLMRHIATNYLLMISHEGELFRICPRSIDLKHEVLDPLLMRYEELLRNSQQSAMIRLTPNQLTVWADPVLLTVIYENLLSNAIKYGQHRGEIILGGRQLYNHTELTFWNEGQSLSDGQIKRLFARFTRDEATSGKDGMGMGLYISRRIIEAHRGQIRVDISQKEGVGFVIALPLGDHA